MIAVKDVAADVTSGRTPLRIFRDLVAAERLDHAARLRDILGRPPLALIAAFSLKTNPRPELVKIARERGFFAEAISSQEIAYAERIGFAASAIIANGPEPVGDRAEGERLAFVFADGIEAFGRNVRRRVGAVQGVRLRPSMIASRFGVPVEDDRELCDAVSSAPETVQLGVSFHVRREDFKGAGWRDVASDVLDRAVALQRRTARRVVAFDVGGGWTPDEFEAQFHADMRWLVPRIVDVLPSCTHVIFEPGQAVCTPAEALVTRVLEVRERRGRREAIVDLAYSDWPQMHSYVHGFFIRRNGAWEPLAKGPDRLGGRTCLEYDLIDGLRFPADLAAGDLLLVTGTGSYDHSMAFRFAEGAPDGAGSLAR
ncbi:MAG TPA: hypothetical protein VGC96_04890 [Candidatus Elarobacter sp.]|jgi:diaminopimelate decarboxylase